MGNTETRHNVERCSASKDPDYNELENVDGTFYGDDSDRKLWLETLGEACDKNGWRIHHWPLYEK